MGLTLSESKKEEVMSNYSRIAWRTVHRYRKTKRLTREDMQDLHQECMVKLIEHMNKCETEEELTSLQIMDLVNAMSKYMMSGCTFTGTRSTEDFRKLVSAQPETMPLSELFDSELVNQAADSFEDSVIMKIDMERFLPLLTEKQRIILMDKLLGYRDVDIARRESVSKKQICAQKKAIRRKYDRFNSESDNE